VSSCQYPLQPDRTSPTQTARAFQKLIRDAEDQLERIGGAPSLGIGAPSVQDRKDRLESVRLHLAGDGHVPTADA
jgi:hypothetical protein